jgi:1-acyl-sn-glycerol-3-phosphate acyltransferase
MYRAYKTPTAKAFPNIDVKEPRTSRLVIFLCKLLGRLYLLLFFGVARIVLQGGNHVFEAFKRTLAGKSRCIIAFRHPNGGEPQLLTWFFLFRLRSLAARKGIRFTRRPHAVFVYGYEVVRWGGWVARFIMPNAGAMPIHHSKIDSKGMARIYNAITEGAYPLALAPEGQVSYTTDAVPRLEPGVIRIGFQAAERLVEKGIDSPVEILPLSIHFRFGSWGKLTLEMLIKKIEKMCGIAGKDRKKIPLIERMSQIRLHVLEVNEERYNIKSDASESFESRLEKVIYSALETSERMMGIKGEGNFFPRMYRARQLLWDRIFLTDLKSFEDVSPVKRNTLDLRAGEAWYIGRHVELIDFCWYFRIPLPTENSVLHEKIEYAQNLWDFASRTMGGAFKDRISIFPRRVIIHAGPVINLSERLPFYRENKRAAISTAMADLEKVYLDCIAEANNL